MARDSDDTIQRFFLLGGFRKATESIHEAAGGSRLSAERIERLAADLAGAAKQDPQRFRVLGDMQSEAEIRDNLAVAVAAMRANGSDAALTERQRSSLEAIILLVGRPALFVQGDTFSVPKGEWEVLVPYKQDISKVIRSVGRIGVAPQYGRPYLGTGFVAGKEGLVMTNRHVVEDFVMKSDGRWALMPGLGMTIDFKQEFGAAAKPDSAFQVAELVEFFEEGPDLALLRIAPRPGISQHLPDPLFVQREPAYANETNMVYVIGYPAADQDRNDATEMHRIFDGVYEKKRFAPGRVTRIDGDARTFDHDCSTLGGNSGSCVVDLATHSVIGLHFEGAYRETNTAVLLPALAGEAALAKVNFQEGRNA